jgi:hypothetical protein
MRAKPQAAERAGKRAQTAYLISRGGVVVAAESIGAIPRIAVESMSGAEYPDEDCTIGMCRAL